MAGTTTQELRGEITPERVEEYINELVGAYTRLRRLDGLSYRRMSQHERFWRQLATALINQGVQPRRYMRWIYKQFRRHTPLVYVQAVTSPKSVQRYIKAAPDRERELELLIRLQWHTLKAELDNGRTLIEILNDPYLELGVVFRYALACHARLPELMAAMKADAEFELYFEPLYAKYLADFLPGKASNGRTQ